MPHLGSMPEPTAKPRTLMSGWISRLDLATELGLSVDTLRRWEAQRMAAPDAGSLPRCRADARFRLGAGPVA